MTYQRKIGNKYYLYASRRDKETGKVISDYVGKADAPAKSYTTKAKQKKVEPNLDYHIGDLRKMANFRHIAHHDSDPKGEQYYDLYFANDEYWILDEGVVIWRSLDNLPLIAKKEWVRLIGQDINPAKSYTTK